MASDHNQRSSKEQGDGKPQRRPPEWADGLKQLYDSVVEEDLPDSFKQLLDQLDATDPAHEKAAPRDGRDAGK